MTTEIAAYAPPAQSEIEYTWNLANKLCKTEFVPVNLRNKPEAVLAVFLTGRELGIGPMQSLRDVYPVNGRPALMATLMVTRVRGLGHRFKTIKSTPTEATVQIHRHEQPDPEPAITFTMEDAHRAGLDRKEIYRQYPTAMLWSRAASAACRRDAAEALGGAVYTPEEIEDGQATTATWGSPEGPPLPDEPSEQTPDPATATPRGQAGSGTTSEAGERGASPRATAGTADRRDDPASDLNASVTGPGDTGVSTGQEPPNAEAPTPPVSPGGGKAGRESRSGRGAAGKVATKPVAPPAEPADEAAEQAAFEQQLADDPGRHTR